MKSGKQNLAAAVREARTGLGLSQEKLAEILNIDSRTIRGIEAGRGNPKFEKLYPLITYLKIPADKIFYSNYENEAGLHPSQNIKDCHLCGWIFQLIALVSFDKGIIMPFGRIICSQENTCIICIITL